MEGAIFPLCTLERVHFTQKKQQMPSEHKIVKIEILFVKLLGKRTFKILYFFRDKGILQGLFLEFHSTTLLYMVFSSTLFAKISESFVNNKIAVQSKPLKKNEKVLK